MQPCTPPLFPKAEGVLMDLDHPSQSSRTEADSAMASPATGDDSINNSDCTVVPHLLYRVVNKMIMHNIGLYLMPTHDFDTAPRGRARGAWGGWCWRMEQRWRQAKAVRWQHKQQQQQQQQGLPGNSGAAPAATNPTSAAAVTATAVAGGAVAAGAGATASGERLPRARWKASSTGGGGGGGGAGNGGGRGSDDGGGNSSGADGGDAGSADKEDTWTLAAALRVLYQSTLNTLVGGKATGTVLSLKEK